MKNNNTTKTALCAKVNADPVRSRILRLMNCKQLNSLVKAQLNVTESFSAITDVIDVISTPEEIDGWCEQIGRISSDVMDIVERVVGRVVYDELFILPDCENMIETKQNQ